MQSVITSQCAQPCCNKLATKTCSACLKEWYCSGGCQKLDWKNHKKICMTLNKLSNSLQPYREVEQVIFEILDAPDNARILHHLLKYAEFQFGDRIPGKAYRQRGSSARIDNYQVEINIVIPIYLSLFNVDIGDTSLSSRIECDDISFLYDKKVLEVLKPWSLCVDSDVVNRVDNLSKDQIDDILKLSSETELSLAIIHDHRNEYDVSEIHHQRSLSYARRYNEEGETKTTLLLHAFTGYCGLQVARGDFAGAVTLAEEAYNCVAEAYNPVHPQVQEAASVLIECLIHKGDLYDAERYSQMTLDNLKDPANKIDQESEAMAKGYYNMGRVINDQKGDLMRAETMARESLRIRALLYGNDHHLVGNSVALLAGIFRKQGNLGDEVKELYERSLSIDVKHEGPDGVNTSISNSNLGLFYRNLAEISLNADERKERLSLSKYYYTEALRINTKVFGQVRCETIDTASNLLVISRALSKA